MDVIRLTTSWSSLECSKACHCMYIFTIGWTHMWSAAIKNDQSPVLCWPLKRHSRLAEKPAHNLEDGGSLCLPAFQASFLPTGAFYYINMVDTTQHQCRQRCRARAGLQSEGILYEYGQVCTLWGWVFISRQQMVAILFFIVTGYSSYRETCHGGANSLHCCPTIGCALCCGRESGTSAPWSTWNLIDDSTS